MDVDEREEHIRVWKMKRLIRTLDSARGEGTSMISLVIPAKGNLVRATKMLSEEFGTATQIKSHSNSVSVQQAIKSAQHQLKLFSRLPPNGVVVYCGTCVTEEGGERRVNVSFEPYRPIHKSLYWCDSKFHTDILSELLVPADKFGFIVLDGGGACFAFVRGSEKTVLHRMSVSLPKKQGRGGQSADRFERIRREKRQKYIQRVAEKATQLFISDNIPNVKGLIIAGLGHTKDALVASNAFDPRLRPAVLRMLDVSYGMECGLNQAVEAAAPVLGSMQLLREQKLLSRFFDHIARDTGLYCYGLDECRYALEAGAVDTLIVAELLTCRRVMLRSLTGEEREEWILSDDAATMHELLKDNETGEPLEVVSSDLLSEWLAENYLQFGCSLELVGGGSPQSVQFCKGMTGIAGILRYRTHFEEYEVEEEDDE
eukprot:TRINITY_DN10313_c0_g1_i1.p1 TRINITY_DN10313_c0_g1~~TRINITY_DN10313_c0_g1_i1.p1  ORF type:complete len:429 (+),score=126.59 TRINITY_DN10313_c0_g1_i1:252-1538(+)